MALDEPLFDIEDFPDSIPSPIISTNKHGLRGMKVSNQGVSSRARSNSSSLNSRPGAQNKSSAKGLIVSFCAMIVVGLGNKIFQKLQTIPMRNYANFLNIYNVFFYLPISFAYIIPMIKYGKQITPQQRKVPQKTFFVMGVLDSLASIMQVFASTYLPGTLLVLLSQSAIPISMVISLLLLKTKYKVPQYLGALVVAGGIVVVLVPRLLYPDSDDSGPTQSTSQILLWSIVMMVSCAPMTLSSVYKEKALGDQELDPVYLNGWIAVYQFLFAIPLALPGGYVTDPPVPIQDLPENIYNGWKCYIGINSVVNIGNATELSTSSPIYYDDCSDSFLFVTVYMLFNVCYNILIILILKYGSANLLWLALTIMVPLSSMAFALDFVPGHEPARLTDVLGLIVMLGGLCWYKFGSQITKKIKKAFKPGHAMPYEAIYE